MTVSLEVEEVYIQRESCIQATFGIAACTSLESNMVRHEIKLICQWQWVKKLRRR